MYFDQVILTRLLFFTILSSRSSVVCFFFESYADHRDLHSFPTRRSSDLRMLPRRAASEVRASEEDRRALCLRLVELELRIQTPIGPKPPVGEEGRPEAGALHPLQELLGNDLVGVDVGAWQRGHGAGVANEV